MRAKVSQLRATSFSFGSLDWKCDLCVAHIERIKKRFVMDERCVINIERDFADQGQRVFAISVIENPYVFRDQTAEGVQR